MGNLDEKSPPLSPAPLRAPQPPRSPLSIPGSPSLYASSHPSPDMYEDSRPLLPRSMPSSPTSPTSSHRAPRLPSRRRWTLLSVVLLLVLIGAWLQSGQGSSSLKRLGDKWNGLSVTTPFATDDVDWDDTTQSDTANVESSPPKQLQEQAQTLEQDDHTSAPVASSAAASDDDDDNSASASESTSASDEAQGSTTDVDSTQNDDEAASTPSLAQDESSTESSEQQDTSAAATTASDEESDDATQDSADEDPLNEIGRMRSLNVRPYPKDPPRDPEVAKKMRYLAFDNHSGFHNQRKSIVNALLLAKMLNRTLLLPPVRLGRAQAWGPDVWRRILHDEECKAGLPLTHPGLTKCANAGLDSWTYVAWTYICQPSLTDGHDIVDRWNSSMAWVYESVPNGGLGLTEADVFQISDETRRSWQIYDDAATKTSLGPFSQRMNLDELLTGEAGEARMIRFGSLFSGARLVTTKPENIAERKRIDDAFILQQPVLDAIADKVRDKLGPYSAVHLRVGDGAFRQHALTTMAAVFRKVVKNMFNLRQVDITALLDATEARLGLMSAQEAEEAKEAADKSHENESRRMVKRSLSELFSWHGLAEEDNDLDEPLELDAQYEASSSMQVMLPPPARSRRSKRSNSRLTKRGPMASTLRCRGELHTEKHLLPLNRPLYVATDARSPLKDAALAPFFDHFPCAFMLSDFAKANPWSTEPVAELVSLVRGDLKSDWDGQGLAPYFFGFLEAEIAARGVKVVGTPGSTFSGYTSGILHRNYLVNGLVATIED